MSLFYEAAEILACLPYYIYNLYVLGIFFKKSASYQIWIPIAFGIIYLPLTATPYKHISNAVMSLVCMLVIFIVSLICYEGNPARKILTIIIYNIFDILLGNILFHIQNYKNAHIQTDVRHGQYKDISSVYWFFY